MHLCFVYQTLNTLHNYSSDITEKEIQYLCDGLRNNTVSYIRRQLYHCSLTFDKHIVITLSMSPTKMANKRFQDLTNVLQNNTVSLILYIIPSFLFCSSFKNRHSPHCALQGSILRKKQHNILRMVYETTW